MHSYSVSAKDIQFILRELIDIEAISKLPNHEDFGRDLAESIVSEAEKFAAGVLAPLNRVGDQQGCKLVDGSVQTPSGWNHAYAAFKDAGWNGLACPTEFGGQGLPMLIVAIVEEIWGGSNMAFTLLPLLNRGAIDALEIAASDEIKGRYIPNMVSGKWTGTMNLTEPQAGSDLASVRTRAEPDQDGSYLIRGQKIFITYGEHDLSENVVHLVLARVADAPEGVKGISLFVVPKFLVNEDGSLCDRNDVRCVAVEHKLGIHGSPTTVLQYGEAQGARGWLVGQENHGLAYMFAMMNTARFSVGLHGVGLSEQAYQKALHYAQERVQGNGLKGTREKVTIDQHPDVHRMLMEMKSKTEAMRAVAYVVAQAMDLAKHSANAEERGFHQAFVDLMIPVVKGGNTEAALEITSMGVQVHGGMGFIEETGAAQYMRDARITTIYEGTTGIQAADLVGRKIFRDGGASARAFLELVRVTQYQLASSPSPTLRGIGELMNQGVQALERSVEWVVASYANKPQAVLASSTTLLHMFATVAGGWQLGRSAIAADRRLNDPDEDTEFMSEKIETARFYADNFLSRVPGLLHSVFRGSNI